VQTSVQGCACLLRLRVRLSSPVLVAALILVVTACVATPTYWQKPGIGDATKDEAECRALARQQAARQLPYGNGPPIFGYRQMSMLEWTKAIDNERYYLEDDLTKACMRDRGFELMPLPGLDTR
jgi:hypothetical protein